MIGRVTTVFGNSRRRITNATVIPVHQSAIIHCDAMSSGGVTKRCASHSSTATTEANASGATMPRRWARRPIS